jgi:hypothetical protein
VSLAGRNTRLQGLAAAILKLWEKSLIAKIAVKVGIQNTNNEQMAWNLKASIILMKYFLTFMLLKCIVVNSFD